MRQLAESQRGVISTSQLERLGAGKEIRARLVHEGVLLRLARAAYVLASTWELATPWQHYELRVRAIALPSAHPSAGPVVVSHVSAASIWGLPLLRPYSDVHVVGSQGSRRTRKGVRKHHSVLRNDIEMVNGVLATSLRRTVVDCATTIPFVDAVAMADAVLGRFCAAVGTRREKVAEAQELYREDLLDLLGQRASRGTDSARRALLFADGRSGSPAESKARVLFASIGLPAPELQLKILTPQGACYPDFALLEHGVLIEVDGVVKVRDPYGGDAASAVEEERRRHIHLQELGWEIVRLTWGDLEAPGLVREKVAAAVRRARMRGIARV